MRIAWLVGMGMVALACSTSSPSATPTCPTVRNGCNIRCLPAQTTALADEEKIFASVKPTDPCPVGGFYAERYEACGRVAFYVFGGPPASTFFDQKTGKLLGIDNTTEGTCSGAGDFGFSCSDTIQCRYLCGTYAGAHDPPRCPPPTADGGADGAIPDAGKD